MKTSHPGLRPHSGFTVVEILIAMSIALLAVSCALGIFLYGLRVMGKDSQRLETNATLRHFLAHISQKSLDSTEFYLFSDYTALDHSIDLTTVWPASSLAQPVADAYGTLLAHGDCLVLVTRLTTDPAAPVRWVRIYYRATTSPNIKAPILYYERDFGAAGSGAPLASILDAITLNAASSPGYRQLVASAIGRKQDGTSNYYPVFSAESPAATPAFASVALNLEIINGTSANNMLSSSSFNYIISPRK
jgi:hypothetical protein